MMRGPKNKLINELAKRFYHTFYQNCWPTKQKPDLRELSIDQSYQVQDIVTNMRIEKGEQVIGFKVGCTSHAIRSQFRLNDPICARLFLPHVISEGVRLNWKNYLNCAIEPEMVFKIDKDLSGENLSDDQLISAIKYVSPGLEIHNFKFWATPNSLSELICSGGVHAALIIGKQKVSAQRLSFQQENFQVFKDNILITQATADQIMGGPLHALRWLVRFLSQKGEILKSGSWVIPGSPVELVPIKMDTLLRIEIDGVGSCVTQFYSD